jgi:hypothetical protein
MTTSPGGCRQSLTFRDQLERHRRMLLNVRPIGPGASARGGTAASTGGPWPDPRSRRRAAGATRVPRRSGHTVRTPLRRRLHLRTCVFLEWSSLPARGVHWPASRRKISSRTVEISLVSRMVRHAASPAARRFRFHWAAEGWILTRLSTASVMVAAPEKSSGKTRQALGLWRKVAPLGPPLECAAGLFLNRVWCSGQKREHPRRRCRSRSARSGRSRINFAHSPGCPGHSWFQRQRGRAAR